MFFQVMCTGRKSNLQNICERFLGHIRMKQPTGPRFDPSKCYYMKLHQQSILSGIHGPFHRPFGPINHCLVLRTLSWFEAAIFLSWGTGESVIVSHIRIEIGGAICTTELTFNPKRIKSN